MGENMNANAIIFFDLETTGLDPELHTIIQIAACAVDKATYDVLEDFEVKIKFRVDKADPEALEGNSYDKDVWAREAVSPYQARDLFIAFIEKYKTVPKIAKGSGRVYNVAQMAGYNSGTIYAGFDMLFFHEWNKKLDNHNGGRTFVPMNYYSVDLLNLAQFNQAIRGVSYEDLKLLTVCRKHGITETQQHDAMDDVRLTAALFPLLVEGVALDNNISQNAPGNGAEQMVMNILDKLPKFDTSYEEI
jgi:DNA polymerase III epsilon subunit-like protein